MLKKPKSFRIKLYFKTEFVNIFVELMYYLKIRNAKNAIKWLCILKQFGSWISTSYYTIKSLDLYNS